MIVHRILFCILFILLLLTNSLADTFNFMARKTEQDNAIGIFLAAPEKLCDLNNLDVRLSRNRIAKNDQITTLPIGSNLFLRYKYQDNIYIYRFKENNRNLVFVTGYTRQDYKTINDVGIINLENAPAFKYETENELTTLEILKHSEISKVKRNDILCSAGIRAMQVEYVNIELKTMPTGAKVWIDGQELNFFTNEVIRVPKTDEHVIVTLQKEGFVPFAFKTSSDIQISVKLNPAP